MSDPTPRQRAQFDVVRLLADLRTWAALGLFGLTWHLFDMISGKPELTGNQGFMALAQLVIGTGFVGGVVAFLFAASKTSADANRAVLPPPAPDPGSPQDKAS